MSAVPRKRRRALIVAAGLLCSALILFAWLRPAPPPHLQVAPVARGNIEQVVEATGTLKPSRLVSVGAQVSGRIDTLHVKLGDKVKAGDLIADIDSRTQRNALLSAQAAQRTARANRDALATDLRQFELTLHRQQQLAASQLVARADFDAAKAKVDATREQIAALDGEVTRRQTDVDVAQTNLEFTRITAPTDGTVLAVVARQGQTVNAVQSAPTIVMLGNQDVMTVYAESPRPTSYTRLSGRRYSSPFLVMLAAATAARCGISRQRRNRSPTKTVPASPHRRCRVAVARPCTTTASSTWTTPMAACAAT